MEIKYNLTEEDYLNFNLFHVKNSKTAKKAMKMQRFLIPIVFIVIPYVLSKMGDMSLFGLLIPFLLISILWIMFYPKYFYHYVIRHTKKLIKEGENDGLLGEHRMILSEEGIVDSASNRETKVTWSGIKTVKEDKHNIYLYNSSVSAYILPKRDLDDVEEIKIYLQSKLIEIDS
ncbi:YcxB family protein [Lederbergia sp. NSJ-179]|uniref:YcxB family protein n=1 Tax=Lederbergia sp. NSJ-179 TaxID=2931402 RepID=UPI001FD20219|nr:YcxB family protein [Lederbergia sp. NSJ-179]MCJ7842473.1 YcxB family protein [Lederbergia sp. NSJ-179]